MLGAFANAFKTPDLRRKILFVLFIVVIFRIGSVVPAPGVNVQSLDTCLKLAQGGANANLYNLINLFSGGALLQLAIFALGIMPYITASIILQLLTVVIPRLESLKKEGQAGQAKITQYTRFLTVGLAILQATAFVALARTPGRLFQGCQRAAAAQRQLVPGRRDGADHDRRHRRGDVARRADHRPRRRQRHVDPDLHPDRRHLPVPAVEHPQGEGHRPPSWWCSAIGLVIMAAVIFIEQAQRRIPVQYAKRMVGRKMFGGTSTYIPLKVNQAGVIPVIFASSLMYLPVLVSQFQQDKPWAQWIQGNLVKGDHPIYMVTYVALIIFFTYFYVSITFNPKEVADNMKKYGGFIPGIRAGRPTEEYLGYVLSRITLPGAIYLAVISMIPLIALVLLNANQNFPFGGTSILIMVGVGLDTVKQIE